MMEKIAQVKFTSSQDPCESCQLAFWLPLPTPPPPTPLSTLIHRLEQSFYGLSQIALPMSTYALGPLHQVVLRLQSSFPVSYMADSLIRSKSKFYLLREAFPDHCSESGHHRPPTGHLLESNLASTVHRTFWDGGNALYLCSPMWQSLEIRSYCTLEMWLV